MMMDVLIVEVRASLSELQHEFVGSFDAFNSMRAK